VRRRPRSPLSLEALFFLTVLVLVLVALAAGVWLRG